MKNTSDDPRSRTDTLKHNNSIETNGTETPEAKKHMKNQFMKHHFHKPNNILSNWFRAWMACPLIIFASTFSCLSKSTEYPSDAYTRPDADSLPVFETLCGVQPGLSNPLERARKFSKHRFELIEKNGRSAAEWEFQFDHLPVPPAILTIEERLSRIPGKVEVTVENRGNTPIEVACQIGEVSWWSDVRRKPENGHTVGVPAILPGESKQVMFTFDAESRVQSLRQPVTLSLFVRDPKPSQTYRVVLSDLTVHYPPDSRKASLPPETKGTAGKEIQFPIEAEGVKAGESLDLQLQDGRWVLWRVRLTEGEVESLAKDRKVTIKRTVPPHLPGRKYSLSLTGPQGRFTSASAALAVENRNRPGFPEMKVKQKGGLPTFFKNGKPMDWSGYATFDFHPGNVTQFGRHGANTFALVANAGKHVHNVNRPTWQDDGSFDFRELDEFATLAMSANPDANLLIRVSLSLPPKWFQKHLDSRVVVRDGDKEVIWEETGGIVPSFVSEAWRKQQAENLRRLIDYIRSQPWADRVAGFYLMGGVTEEWFAWGCNDKLNGDYSPVQQEAFRSWCGRRGLDVGGMPAPGESMARGVDFFPDTAAGRRASAYQQFINETTADTLNLFIDEAKKAAPHSLVGVFYGYVIQCAGEPRQSWSGQLLVRRLLENPNLDFLAGVPLHNFRTIPDALEAAFLSQGGATGSVQLAGKSYVDENDLFSWLHGGVWHTLFDSSNPRAGAITMHRRVLADDVVNGISRYWYSLLASWHDDEALQREFALEHRIQSESLSWDRTPCPEIALLVDDTSFAWITPFSNYFRYCNPEFVYALAKTGSSVRVYLLSDADRLPSSVKFVVVSNAVAARPADLAKLSALLEKGGRTILVTGPIGLINPETQARDFMAPARILGLPLEVKDGAQAGVLKEVSSSIVLVDMTKIPDWARSSGMDTGGTVSPFTISTQPGWAVYSSESKLSAGAERPLKDGGKLLWAALPVNNIEVLRKLVETSGAYCYAPTGYVVNAAAGVVSVTAPRKGSVTLRFPQNARWKDVLDASEYSGAEFPCDFTKGQTRIFVRAQAEVTKDK